MFDVGQLDDVSNVLTNIIFDFGILFYNYAKGFTDRASTTTVQLRTLKIILLLIGSDSFTSLTVKQEQLLSGLSTAFIQEMKPSKK